MQAFLVAWGKASLVTLDFIRSNHIKNVVHIVKKGKGEGGLGQTVPQMAG